jgi:hypothetical protein
MHFITHFTIKELDNGWGWPDIETTLDGECFCEEELEIPQQYLKEIQLYEDEMQVTLCRDKSYVRDDWYVNLSRISA